MTTRTPPEYRDQPIMWHDATGMERSGWYCQICGRMAWQHPVCALCGRFSHTTVLQPGADIIPCCAICLLKIKCDGWPHSGRLPRIPRPIGGKI